VEGNGTDVGRHLFGLGAVLFGVLGLFWGSVRQLAPEQGVVEPLSSRGPGLHRVRHRGVQGAAIQWRKTAPEPWPGRHLPGLRVAL